MTALMISRLKNNKALIDLITQADAGLIAVPRAVDDSANDLNKAFTQHRKDGNHAEGYGESEAQENKQPVLAVTDDLTWIDKPPTKNGIIKDNDGNQYAWRHTLRPKNNRKEVLYSCCSNVDGSSTCPAIVKRIVNANDQSTIKMFRVLETHHNHPVRKRKSISRTF